MIHLAIIIGTRPDAIKLSPVIYALENIEGFQISVIATAQHREMLDMVIDVFQIKPEIDFNIMIPDQTLPELSRRLIPVLDEWLSEKKPDLLIVQGDTTSSMTASLVAYYNRIPVVHVEAGLRTHDINYPFPEELNRVYIDHTAELLMAPTPLAKENLLREGVPEGRIYITGNTVIDALIRIRKNVNPSNLLKQIFNLRKNRRLVVVTAHRRENFGEGILNIIKAVKSLSHLNTTLIVWPVHPNPNVHRPVFENLSQEENILLTDPLPYPDMIQLIEHSDLVLTDSGGLQEECSFLNVPVLVLREKTERQEIIEAGIGRLVGTNPDTIIKESLKYLNSPGIKERLKDIPCPYGSGDAGEKIAGIIKRRYG